MERRLENWLESELHRFHRGISFSVLLLATVILIAESVRYPGLKDRGALMTLLLPIGIVQCKLFASLGLRHRESRTGGHGVTQKSQV